MDSISNACMQASATTSLLASPTSLSPAKHPIAEDETITSQGHNQNMQKWMITDDHTKWAQNKVTWFLSSTELSWPKPEVTKFRLTIMGGNFFTYWKTDRKSGQICTQVDSIHIICFHFTWNRAVTCISWDAQNMHSISVLTNNCSLHSNHKFHSYSS